MNENLLESIDLLIARKIPLNQATAYECLPLYEKDNKVYVATSNESKESKSFLEFLLEKEIVFKKYKKSYLSYLIRIILYKNYENIEDDIIKEAINMKASDIHFEPRKSYVDIRFRINGTLILARKLMKDEYLKINSRLKIKANMDITEKRKPQDGKILINLDDSNYNCRLSTIPLITGEKLVLRIIYRDKYLSKLEKLDFLENQKEDLKKIISLENGLVIINGPTGSGKTTTLYSILREIRNGDINITTIEDPVEVNMNGVNQMNLNPKIGVTFSSGLRSILRQDPDVIMVGEIRDEETAAMAVRAAITGHKVYSTIHTKSPREVFLRLEDMGIKDYLLRDSLVGIISQRLIRVLCDECKKSIGKIRLGEKEITIFKKVGCNKCHRTGFVGRTLVSSVNFLDKNIKDDIKNIHKKEDILSNYQMIEVLKSLLIKGNIDYYDYLEFIEGESLSEGKC
ncbi:GspE/PulE family protein [uncultured Clostridium sp.]|uniref:GspE/PulE family protein n=1 Tax=uncultured Clostridium sp. TaxID=59620 RepID=UPI0025F28831|nr:GspE/PulE family protein [uncultured Clostridium sp.]